MDKKVCQSTLLSTSTSTSKGFQAEQKAWDYFERNFNVQLICKNFRWKRGEIDLVVYDLERGELVFIEVRSAQSSKTAERLLYSINANKQFHLNQTIEVFLRQKKTFRLRPKRVDIVWVFPEKLEHWRGVEI